MKTSSAVVIAGIVLGAGVGALVKLRARAPSTPEIAAVTLQVPRTTAEIVPDGELEDWPEHDARTSFRDGSDAGARPYSDARFVWRDKTLYVVLYAADEDIRATGPTRDAFRLAFHTPRGERTLEIAPAGAPGGTLASAVRLGRDADGTIDDPSGEDDEEWLVEMAIPLAELALEGKVGERVRFSIERCDTPRDGRRRCARALANELRLAE